MSMKKIFYTLLLLMAVAFTTSSASAQMRYPMDYDHGYHHHERMESFLYFPQSNVYLSLRTHQYIYPSNDGWQMAYRLPRYLRYGREDRVVVQHQGFDVWNDNATHQYTYGRRYNTPPAIVYGPDRRYNGY